MAEKHTHTRDHEHDEDNLITLIDDEGNEVLFEVLLNIDATQEFGKYYVLLVPAGAEDGNEEVEVSAYAYTINEDGTSGDLLPIPEDAEDEWALIEDSFAQAVEGEE